MLLLWFSLKQKRLNDIHVKKGKASVIEFAASSYAVLENEQVCRIVIERYGKIDQQVTFKLVFFS